VSHDNPKIRSEMASLLMTAGFVLITVLSVFLLGFIGLCVHIYILHRRYNHLPGPRRARYGCIICMRVAVLKPVTDTAYKTYESKEFRIKSYSGVLNSPKFASLIAPSCSQLHLTSPSFLFLYILSL
jgi:nitrate reductase NapE component